MPDKLEAIIARAVGEKLSSQEIQSLVLAVQSGNATLATDDRSVELGGYASDAVIVTGDRNVIVKGGDIETIKQLIQKQSASKGLYALSELMSVPEVRNTAIAFRADFQAVCEQVEVLGNYKDLHDLLHTLEFQCYRGIVQEAKRFPDDESALDILMEHELTLQHLVDEIRDVAKQETLASSEIPWLKDLAQAQEELHAAINQSDTQRLKTAIRLVNRVLTIQPSRINTSLNNAASALRLPALVHAMIYIQDQLAHIELDQEKTSQFRNGIDSLVNLSHNLTFLVENHNDWQNVDSEIRRIEADLERDTSELEMSWSDLKAMTEPLYSSSIDTWAVSIKKDSENLDSAIADKNPVKIKRYFRFYRRQAGERFYRVDVKLKRLCEDVRIVGEPLASVLRMME